MGKRKVLVTGGSGLVGNALQRVCPDAVYVSSKDYDLTKEAEVKAMFEKYRPTYVIYSATLDFDVKFLPKPFWLQSIHLAADGRDKL